MESIAEFIDGIADLIVEKSQLPLPLRVVTHLPSRQISLPEADVARCGRETQAFFGIAQFISRSSQSPASPLEFATGAAQACLQRAFSQVNPAFTSCEQNRKQPEE